MGSGQWAGDREIRKEEIKPAYQRSSHLKPFLEETIKKRKSFKTFPLNLMKVNREREEEMQ